VPANRQQNHWKFHWLTRWAEIWDEDFVLQWQAWLEESPSAYVFFHPALVKAWVETYLPSRDLRPCFLIAESNAHTVFFPLVLWRRNWKNAFQRLLIPVGYSDYDYHDPIFTGSPDHGIQKYFWKAFFNELETRWGGFFDTMSVNGLHYNSFPKNVAIRKTDVSPCVNLEGINSLEDVIKSLSKRTREDVRRKGRKLEEIGEIKLRIFSIKDLGDAISILPTILGEHSKKWPESFKAPGFHEYLVKYSLETGLLHMSELTIDDNPISWHIGFLHKSRYYWYMPVYKSEFQKYSPGQTHLLMCIEDALNKGAVIFDFLRGNERYKNRFAQDSEDLFEARLDSKTITSSARIAVLDFIKPFISKLKRKASSF